MYDSIQGFAFALNTTLQVMNLTLENCLKDSNIADTIQSEMMMLSFAGVLGHVEFDNNHEQQTKVDIFQVRNGNAIQIGSYDPVSTEIILENVSRIDDVLSNGIPRIYRNASMPVAVLLFIVTGVCIVLTTVVLILFIYYRKAVEIKATSLNLSLLMFLGCYLLFISILFHTVSDLIVNHGPFFCNFVIWCAGLGTNFC